MIYAVCTQISIKVYMQICNAAYGITRKVKGTNKAIKNVNAYQLRPITASTYNVYIIAITK